MSTRDFLAIVAATLGRNRLRTGLTMFGIIWGVAFSLIMGGMNDALGHAFVDEMERFGLHEVFLWPGHTSPAVGGYRAGRDLRFTAHSLDALRRHCPSLARLSPQIWTGFAEVKFGSRVRSFPLNGVDPPIHDIRVFPAARGRRLNDDDLAHARRVAFIGDNVRDRLFGAIDPVGRHIRIDNVLFTVVGVAGRKGDAVFQSGWQDDDMVLIPATTTQRLFLHSRYYPMLILQAASRPATYQLVTEVRRVLAGVHGFRADDEDALAFFNTVDNIMRVVQIQGGSSLFGTVVVLATLVIGGIGLANILVVSVNERTREIGLRRALGATRGTITRQLFAEALVITLVAGAIGVGVAALIRAALSIVPLPALFTPPTLPPRRIAGTLAFMLLVGLLAGIAPARRAQRIDPAIALRYE